MCEENLNGPFSMVGSLMRCCVVRWPPVCPRQFTVQLQKRYYRCVQKFAGCFVAGQIREESRDVCLNRFDDFRECVEVSDGGSFEAFEPPGDFAKCGVAVECRRR